MKTFSSYKHLNFLCVTILLLLYSVKGYFFYGNEIRDLESNTSYFATETQNWTLAGVINSTSNVSQCGGTWLLGGYGILGTGATLAKTYTSLPPHNIIYFSIDAYLIDLQELTNLFKIYFDTTLVNTWSTSLMSTFLTFTPSSQICGTSRSDYAPINIKGQVAHNSSSLTFKIVSLFNSQTNQYSLGFRNLNMLFQVISTTPSTSACTISDYLGSSSSCLCSKGQYDPSGLLGCTSCNANCQTCSGSSQNSCTSCAAGYSFSGTTCFQCDSSCYQCNGTAATNCIRCSTGKYLYWNGTCQSSCPSPLVTRTVGMDLYCDLPCGTGYLYQNNTCGASCTTPTPFASSTSALYTTLKYCNFTCTSASQYLYWNNTCYTGCASPFINVTKGVERYCNLPCSGTQVYHLKNNTCQASCQYPYIQYSSGGFNYCQFKCSTSDYLYWNGSCLPTCPTSYQVISGTEKYCNMYCPTNQFLYPNSTCRSTCDSPLVQTVDAQSYKKCSLPCTSGQYVYPDNSCQSSCAYVNSTNQDGVLLCNYPCAQSSFLYQNNTCRSNCTTPYVPVTVNSNFSLCNSPCTSPQIYLPSSSSCVSQCPSPLVALQDGTLQYCGNSSTATSANQTNSTTPTNAPNAPNASNTSNPNTTTNAATNTNNTTNTTTPSTEPTDNGTIHYSSGGMEAFARVVGNIGDVLRRNGLHSGFVYVLVKLIKTVRYMNVPLHQDIQNIINSNTSTLNISITDIFSHPMSSNFKKQFTERRLTEIYDQQSHQATYIVNHWNNLLVYVILLGLGLLFTNVEKLVTKFKNRTLILIIKRLRIITRWNFFLCILFNTYDDLTLFAAFEFKNGLHSDLFPIIFGFLVSIAMSCIALYILGKTFWICKQALKCKHQLVDEKSAVVSPDILFYKKWEDYQVVFAGYKNTSLMSQTFLFWFTCRIIITYLFIAFLESSPLIQSLIFTLLSILMIFYLLKVRPIKEKFSFVANLIVEILLLIMNSCLLLLTAADATDSVSPQSSYGLSLAVLAMYLMIEVLGNVFAWTYVVLAMWAAYKAGKKYGLSGKTSWLNIIVAPFKNPGLTFSDLSNNEFAKQVASLDDELPVRRQGERGQRKKPSWIDKMSTTVAARLRLRRINGRIVPVNYQMQDQDIEDKSTLPDKSIIQDQNAEYRKLNSFPRIPISEDEKSKSDIEAGGEPQSTTPRLIANLPMSPLHLPEPLSTATVKKGSESSSPISLASTLYTKRKSSFGIQSQQSKKEGKSTDNIDGQGKGKTLFGSHEYDTLGLKSKKNRSDTLSLARNASQAEAEIPNFIPEEEFEDSPAKLPGKAFKFAEDVQTMGVGLMRKDSDLSDNTPSTPSNWLLKRSLSRKNQDKSVSYLSNIFNTDHTPMSTQALIRDINGRGKLLAQDAESKILAETPVHKDHKDLFSPNSSFMSADHDDTRRDHKSIISDLFAQPKKLDLSREWALEKISEFRRNSQAVLPQKHF